MKLTFRDLKQQKFTLEAEPSETVLQVKEKIQGEKSWEASTLKLIYSGKILQDSNTIESYNIQEKDFIVCMVSKPKPAVASSTAAASSTQSAPPSTPASHPAQTPAVPPALAQSTGASSAAPATPSPAAPAAGAAAAASPADFNDPSALALGAQREAAIANMEGMGFARSDIDRAMRAAYFNPDRAVEYLLNGIPENVQQEQSAGQQQEQAGTGNVSATTAASGEGAAPTATTATNTEGEAEGDQPINLFEAAAQANRGGSAGGAGSRGLGRGAAAAVAAAAQAGAAGGTGSGGGGAAGGAAAGLAGLGAGGTGGGDAAGAGNLDFLRNNPQFQQLRQIVQTQPRMLEPILQQVGNGNPQLAQLIGDNPEQFLRLLSEDAGEDVPLPPGAQEISVTEEERDAIERLCRLGFERDLVIQAYFACDKNEELAANFLFDQPDEDEGGAAT